MKIITISCLSIFITLFGMSSNNENLIIKRSDIMTPEEFMQRYPGIAHAIKRKQCQQSFKRFFCCLCKK